MDGALQSYQQHAPTSRFSRHHCTNCRKGGFVSTRHNNLRDLMAKMFSEVFKDIEIDPELSPSTCEELDSTTANTTNEARLDVKERGVWEKREQAFLNLSVFDPNYCRYFNKCLQQCVMMISRVTDTILTSQFRIFWFNNQSQA